MKQHYQGLGHIAVYTADMDASIAFYEKIISGPPPARRNSSGSWPLWSSAASWWS